MHGTNGRIRVASRIGGKYREEAGGNLDHVNSAYNRQKTYRFPSGIATVRVDGRREISVNMFVLFIVLS